MIDNQVLIKQLNILLNGVKNKLPQNDVKNILEFIDNNEFGLAFETLCTQLYEYNIQISSEFYEKISSCGKSINIPSSIWLSLKELIII
jgi:hypothetical protein